MIAEILTLVLLLILSGIFSGSEVALVSVSRFRVRQMVEKGVPKAEYIRKLKADQQRMLATILIGNNLANVGASALITAVFIELFASYAVGIATGVMTLLILVFGEITPKTFAAKNNEKMARAVAKPIWYLSVALYPIIYLLNHLMDGMNRVFRVSHRAGEITEEDIATMVKVAQEEGAIKDFERSYILNIFEFDERAAGDILTPRSDLVAVKDEATIKEALDVMMEHNYSRVPIYHEIHDKIVGIIYIKDILGHKNKRIKVKSVMKDPYFVPESKKISNLLKQFQKRSVHIAVVVDEHGSVTGIVTLEDVLEEIVGEIMDETDEASPEIKKHGKKWVVKGNADINAVSKKLGVDLERNGYSTISGFFLEHTEKIPEKGDFLMHKGYKFEVAEVKNNRIMRMKVEEK